MSDVLHPAGRIAPLAAVIGVHALILWALLQVVAVRPALVDAAPIFVRQIFIEAPKPSEPAPPAPPQPPRAIKRNDPAPPLVIARTQPQDEPAPFMARTPEPVHPVPSTVEVAPTTEPPAPSPPPQPALITEIAYARAPSVIYPVLSRGLSETGLEPRTYYAGVEVKW